MQDFDEMKLARVIDACNGVDGRVKLQKIVYILKSIGYDLPFNDFRIRQHGPFSRELACSADILATAGFVKEKSSSWTNQSGEQVPQYCYAVSDSIKSLLRDRFNISGSATGPTLDECANELGKHTRAVLEVAATKLYLIQEDNLRGKDLSDELSRLKSHLSNQFDAADEFLKDLNEKGWMAIPSDAI